MPNKLKLELTWIGKEIRKELEESEVLAKKDAAVRWCKNASDHNAKGACCSVPRALTIGTRGVHARQEVIAVEAVWVWTENKGGPPHLLGERVPARAVHTGHAVKPVLGLLG
ncbi:MAG TPA: hypothetical protein PKM57_11960 [Kiritimatiellia bacterium]|jgi:hypothetical protein|nr:hypothetical protein [Kiritimatiellia bacterium]HPS08531.1 hypothetical protein [Kiritimatiellia bacterium]